MTAACWRTAARPRAIAPAGRFELIRRRTRLFHVKQCPRDWPGPRRPTRVALIPAVMLARGAGSGLPRFRRGDGLPPPQHSRPDDRDLPSHRHRAPGHEPPGGQAGVGRDEGRERRNPNKTRKPVALFPLPASSRTGHVTGTSFAPSIRCDADPAQAQQSRHHTPSRPDEQRKRRRRRILPGLSRPGTGPGRGIPSLDRAERPLPRPVRHGTEPARRTGRGSCHRCSRGSGRPGGAAPSRSEECARPGR